MNPGYPGGVLGKLINAPIGTMPFNDLCAPLGSKTSTRVKEDDEN